MPDGDLSAARVRRAQPACRSSTAAAAAPTDLVLPISTLGRRRPAHGPRTRNGARPAWPFGSRCRSNARSRCSRSCRSAATGGRSSRTTASASGSPTSATGSRCAGTSTRRRASSATPGRLRFGLPDEPSLRSVFSVRALHVSPRHAGRERSSTSPRRDPAQDQGASRGRAERRASGDRVRAGGARARSAGLTGYRVVLPRDDAGETLVVVRGRPRVPQPRARRVRGTVTRRSARSACRPRRSRSPVAASRTTSRPRGTTRRRIAIHAAGTDLYLESNLPRSRAARGRAAALPVQGLPMPAAWTHRRVGRGDGRSGSRSRPLGRPSRS